MHFNARLVHLYLLCEQTGHVSCFDKAQSEGVGAWVILEPASLIALFRQQCFGMSDSGWFVPSKVHFLVMLKTPFEKRLWGQCASHYAYKGFSNTTQHWSSRLCSRRRPFLFLCLSLTHIYANTAGSWDNPQPVMTQARGWSKWSTTSVHSNKLKVMGINRQPLQLMLRELLLELEVAGQFESVWNCITGLSMQLDNE